METKLQQNVKIDYVKGCCWSLYRNEAWLRSWFEECAINWKDEIEFKCWIETKNQEGEILNGV